MAESITVTVPLDNFNALNRAADMFYKLAADVQAPAVTAAPRAHLAAVVPITPTPAVDLERAAAEIFDTPPPVMTLIDETAPNPLYDPATVFATPLDAAATVPAAVAAASDTPPPYTPPPAAAAGVELDAAGLPWDHRIHSSSKAKLAKTGEWKVARGMDPATVTAVTAELRAAMGVPVPAPVVTLAPASAPHLFDVVTPPAYVPPVVAAPPRPAATVTPPPVYVPPAVPAASSGSVVKTFADLMKKITTHGKKPAEVAAAAQHVGLVSVAMLGARPDLIPAVDAFLFPAVV